MDYKQKYLKYKSKYLDLKEQIGGDSEKIKKLKNAGFTEDFIKKNTKSIDDKKISLDLISRMIYLKEAGFSEDSSYKYATDLQTEQIINIIKLKKEAGFSEDSSYKYATDLQTEQIINIIKLKKEAGFSEDSSYKYAKDLKVEQIIIMIKLKKEAGFSEEYAFKSAKINDIKIHEIENMIRFKKAGFEDFYSYIGALNLTNKEIDDLINSFINDESDFDGSKLIFLFLNKEFKEKFTEDQIIIYNNLPCLWNYEFKYSLFRELIKNKLTNNITKLKKLKSFEIKKINMLNIDKVIELLKSENIREDLKKIKID